MTDLKALRREIARETCAGIGLGESLTVAYLEAALLQYAEAVLGEPSEGMIDASEFANGAAEIWEVMGMKRLKEIK